MMTIIRLFTIALVFSILCGSCSKDDSQSVISGEGVFQTLSGDALIEGELFLPEGNGPFPSMIIVPGSGNEPRQELEPFADVLTQNGYALYIYDKRGVGASTGSYPAESLENDDFIQARAEDVIGIIEFLQSHTDIDNTRIGVYGSSQGAWVNSAVFQRKVSLAYIVMVSGGVASIGLEGYYCSLTDDPAISIDEAIAELANYTGLTGYDPLPIIQSMDLPVLWIYGNEDRSHPARYDIGILESLSKNNFTLQVYEDVGHELLDVNTGQMPPTIIPALGTWLTANN